MRSLPLASGSAMVMLALLSLRIFRMRCPPGPMIAPASSLGIVTCQIFHDWMKDVNKICVLNCMVCISVLDPNLLITDPDPRIEKQ